MTTGDKIKYYREQAGMTMEQLANEIGVQNSAINKYEKGIVTNIPINRIRQIAEALGVDPRLLLDFLDDSDKRLEELRSNPDLLALMEAARGLGEEDLKQLIWMANRMNQAAAAEGQALHEELDRQLAKEKGTQAKSQA